MIQKFIYLLLTLIVIQAGRLQAQEPESIMNEVSYVFLEKLIATAKENYPRMSSFEGRIRVAKSDVSREQLSWLDAFSFSYVYNPNNTLDIVNPNFFNGYQVAFNVNLSSLFQKPSNVRQARENQKLAEFDLAEYHLTLEAEVKRRYYAYLQALNLLKLQTRITADALNMSRDSRLKYEKSEITFEQYTASQMTYNASLQSQIGAEANFLNAKSSIEELIAKKIEEVQ
jgi:outer membrane protein TolC